MTHYVFNYGHVVSYKATMSQTSHYTWHTEFITKYGSTLYIGMDEVSQHHAHTFEKSNLNFHFKFEFSYVTAEW